MSDSKPSPRLHSRSESRLNCRGDDLLLPAIVKTIVPTCAQSCIADYIQEAFVPSVCASATNSTCLCDHYSDTGYTLGEISLACVKSGCPSSNSSQSLEAYEICDNISAAVSPTHSVLTLLSSATSSTSIELSTTSTTSSTPSTTTSASSTTTPGSSTSITVSTITSRAGTSVFAASASAASTTLITVSSSTSATTTSTSSTASSSATITNQAAKHLTNTQVTEVSVGSASAVLVVVLLLFCCVCRRKRRKQKEKKERKHSYDFVDQEPPRSPQRKRPTKDEFDLYFSEGRNSGIDQKPKAEAPRYRPAASPIAEHQESRPSSINSRCSEETTSRLLPERPLRGPQVVRQLARPDSTATRTTVFEEDKSPGLLKSPLFFPQSPLPAHLARKDARSDVRFAERPRDLRIAIPLSQKRPPYPCESVMMFGPGAGDLHTPTDDRTLVRPVPARMSMPLNSAATYLPSYYTSADSRTPKIPEQSPPRDRLRPAVPTRPQRSFKLARASHASETSFESVDPDEPTPPEEEDKRLPTVNGSPISGLKYPKIPRSSNQAIPRSPPQALQRFNRPKLQVPTKVALMQQKDKEPSSLWVRRHGASGGQSGSLSSIGSPISSPVRKDPAIQKGKFIVVTPPLSPRTKHLPYLNQQKAQDRIALSGEEKRTGGTEMSLKSALWEPKLTPTRKGDALYISVASPKPGDGF